MNTTTSSLFCATFQHISPMDCSWGMTVLPLPRPLTSPYWLPEAHAGSSLQWGCDNLVHLVLLSKKLLLLHKARIITTEVSA